MKEDIRQVSKLCPGPRSKDTSPFTLSPLPFPLSPFTLYLIEKGLIKTENFRQSPNKTRYLYNLTPRGIEEKAKVTARFLKQKLLEYEEIKSEIKQLQSEAEE